MIMGDSDDNVNSGIITSGMFMTQGHTEHCLLSGSKVSTNKIFGFITAWQAQKFCLSLDLRKRSQDKHTFQPVIIGLVSPCLY